MNFAISGFWTVLLALGVLVVASMLVRAAATRFYVSRQVAYLAALAMLCGLCILISIPILAWLYSGAGLRGPLLASLVLLVEVLLLSWLVSSAALRRTLRVLINKHFYRSKHDYRLEWLRFAGKMSTVATQNVHAVSIEAVAEVFGSMRGVLWVLDENGHTLEHAASWSRAQEPVPARSPSIDVSSPMVSELLAKGWIIDTEEYRSSPAIYGGAPLPEWLVEQRLLRLVSPIRRADKLVGVLALGTPSQPFQLTYEDRDLLATLGQQIGTHLAQFDADRKIAESKQFETFNQLTAFMMHDLKNAVAQLRLVVSNAAKHKRNPEFVDDAVVTIGNAVTRIDRLIGQLHFGVREAAKRKLQIDDVVRSAIERCAVRSPVPTLDQSAPGAKVEADLERLVSVLEHAIRNAQDATSEKGSVRLSVDPGPGIVSIAICDDGVGMNPEFIRERLFSPFDTTKGAAGMGIGAYQVREYAHSLGGRVEVQSKPGLGTRFVIILPTVNLESHDD